MLRPVVTNAQGRGQQAANAAKKPVKAAQQTSLFQGLAQAQGQLNDSNVSWTTFLGLALLAGVTFGSVIQVSHNNPNLPVSRCCRPVLLLSQQAQRLTRKQTSHCFVVNLASP